MTLCCNLFWPDLVDIQNYIFARQKNKVEHNRIVGIVYTWTTRCRCIYQCIQLFQLRTKVVHEQSGKVEYERERLLGIALKIH